MIKSVKVTNYLGESITLELGRPDLSGFVITNIEGLGPPKSTVNTTELSTKDGSTFNSSRVPSRNITISIMYEWKDTIEDARQTSYKYFPIKRFVTLLVETDNRLASIQGVVESNEPEIFSEKSGAEISIICPYPFFYSEKDGGIQTTIFSGVEPLFEFPFSNESLTEDLINMGEILEYSENVIHYDGDVEIGVTIYIHAMGEASNIAIYNLNSRESMMINTNKIASYTGKGITAGDDITICTVQGSKSVTLLREGTTYNILNCMDKDIDWLQLSKGDNLFVYTAEDGQENLQFRIENRLAYEGV